VNSKQILMLSAVLVVGAAACNEAPKGTEATLTAPDLKGQQIVAPDMVVGSKQIVAPDMVVGTKKIVAPDMVVGTKKIVAPDMVVGTK